MLRELEESVRRIFSAPTDGDAGSEQTVSLDWESRLQITQVRPSYVIPLKNNNKNNERNGILKMINLCVGTPARTTNRALKHLLSTQPVHACVR